MRAKTPPKPRPWKDLSPKLRNQMMSIRVMGFKSPLIGWTPSSVLDDAWTIVEKLQREGWYLTLKLLHDELKIFYWAEMQNNVYGCENHGAVGETACEAICLVALSIKGVTDHICP